MLFTRGELAGRNFHYHFVVDRGMPYEVRLLLGSACVRPHMRDVAVRPQWWPSLALLTAMHATYWHLLQNCQSLHLRSSACLVPARRVHVAP